MNKKIKTITYIVIFIISIVIIFLAIRNLQEQSNQIIEVSDESFEKEVLHSKKKVLIDFYATWCNPCQALAPIIEEVASEYSNIKVIKVDVDKCKNVVSKYNINAIPTLIVLDNGNEIKRSVGADSKNEVLEICGLN